MGQDLDQVNPTVIYALVRVTEGVAHLTAAVRSKIAPDVQAHVSAAVQEAHEQQGRVYHVDEWAVRAHTRCRNGKEFPVRAFTARPRKEQNGAGTHE